jgi:ubiquinone/menaquinone biosynthesis C-methylase UbiE
MPDYHDIYAHHADKYDYLVTHEDHEKNLLRKIFTLKDIRGMDAVEIGAGTGRMTFLLAPFVNKITAFEITDGMLDFAKKKLEQKPHPNVHFKLGDNKTITMPDNSADLVIEGWSFAQMMAWNMEIWQDLVDRSISEMTRVAKPGGLVVLIETLGTLHEHPTEPEHFKPLYKHFEEKHGFKREFVRTDYKFDSAAQSEYYINFFFGEAFGQKVKEKNLTVVPECTGIWHKTVEK